MDKVKSSINKPLQWFLHTTWKKKIAVIIFLGVAIFFLTSPLRVQGTTYTTAVVKRETIQETVSESGNIASSGQSGVSSPSTGVIEELDVNNGDNVTAGQTLFKVKATATAQDKANAYTTYENAISVLQTAQNNIQSLDATMWTKQQAYLTAQNNQNYKNNNTTNPTTKNSYTDLEKQQIDSAVTQTQKDFNASQQAYKTANVAVAAAQAQVDSTGLAYQATQDVAISAPVGGTVENLAYGIGDNVTGGTSQTTATTTSSSTTSSSSTASSSTPVLYIVTDGKYNNSLVQVQVNEVDFSKIQIGQTVDITLPALPNKKFHGQVVKIDKLGTNSSSVIYFNVSISIDNPDSHIAPNMTVSADIKTSKHDNALVVPNAAIKPYKRGKAVEVLDKSKPSGKQIKFVSVKIGIKGFDSTEITSGVNEGTVVVTGSNASTTTSSSGGGGGPFGG